MINSVSALFGKSVRPSMLMCEFDAVVWKFGRFRLVPRLVSDFPRSISSSYARLCLWVVCCYANKGFRPITSNFFWGFGSEA